MKFYVKDDETEQDARTIETCEYNLKQKKLVCTEVNEAFDIEYMAEMAAQQYCDELLTNAEAINDEFTLIILDNQSNCHEMHIGVDWQPTFTESKRKAPGFRHGDESLTIT